MKDTLINVDNINYSVDNKPLIKNLSISIKRREVLSIIGYNGCGKSTLLKILVGSVAIDSGTIDRIPGLRLGYVPQKLGFEQNIPLTVRDFLALYNKDTSAHAIACGQLAIKDLLDRPLSGLSGGQLQKVLMHNALLGKPDILLLDEPTAGLDVSAQEEFYTLLNHIRQDHDISIVLVSHDLHSVYSKSDKIICLHKGVCCSGSPCDKNFSDSVSDMFGDHVMPYLHHQHKHNDG